MQFSPPSVPTFCLLHETTKQNQRHLTLQKPAQARSTHFPSTMNETWILWKNSMWQCNKNNLHEREGQGETLVLAFSSLWYQLLQTLLPECKILDIGQKKKKGKNSQLQHPSQVLRASLQVLCSQAFSLLIDAYIPDSTPPEMILIPLVPSGSPLRCNTWGFSRL